jgi:hypothetical protein
MATVQRINQLPLVLVYVVAAVGLTWIFVWPR